MNTQTQNIILLGYFKVKGSDLAFEAESENGQLYEVLIDRGEIADYLEISFKQMNLTDGLEDIQEAGEQVFDRWKTGQTYYNIQIKKLEE